ncbi:MAG: GyrI-like domain-containing protein [Parachlamydiales bacterium]|jgi:predicted transcriptional regulator YdeE
MTDSSIVKVQKKYIMGIECRTSNMPGAASKDIPQLWGRFYTENIMSQIPKISDDVYALYCEYEGDYTAPYTCMIGCMVSSMDNIPAGLVAKVIPASDYAKYEAKGEFPQSVLNTWVSIWNGSLKRTYVVDFEVYDSRFATESNKPVDIYVGIKG